MVSYYLTPEPEAHLKPEAGWLPIESESGRNIHL